MFPQDVGLNRQRKFMKLIRASVLHAEARCALKAINDFDKDLAMWNGSWIRAPRPKNCTLQVVH